MFWGILQTLKTIQTVMHLPNIYFFNRHEIVARRIDIIIIIILHTVICDRYGRLDYKHFGSSYGLSTRGQHLIYIR